MEGDCWFCGEGDTEPTGMVEVPLFKTLKEEREDLDLLKKGGNHRIKITSHYLPETVCIPRCNRCAQRHRIIVWVSLLAAAATAAGLILLSATFLRNVANAARYRDSPIVGTCVALLAGALLTWGTSALVTRAYLRKAHMRPLSDRTRHPEVERLLGLGYQLGKSPADTSLPSS